MCMTNLRPDGENTEVKAPVTSVVRQQWSGRGKDGLSKTYGGDS